ncbi:metal ABC transporter solute-binding protein, Zn/Mn family [Desulfurispira natronophila]|uniref:Zinc transport system substrate-binding protein n=1 Tax=Desulfurispira natronophila TaxID=682562 RepID=A0A7W8DGJ6_9BACT|nr:zinc ABC transporter substrate-binding protein [Desulfurispira natronophila]MBB5021480.1 zinc transport system substrate-binding protein [Desulfurispira natronophila]
MKKLYLLLGAILAIIGFAKCALAQGQLVVYTSTYPLYEFSQRIGGEQVEVRNILPPGADAHDYEPSTRQMMDIASADIFVYNGGGFELWIDKLLQALDGDHQLVIVNTTADLPLLEVDHHHDHHHHSNFFSRGWNWLRHALGGSHDEHHCHHGPEDPHVWLDPTMAVEQARTIKEKLIEVDRDNSSVYENNFTALEQDLLDLDKLYQKELADLPHRQFVVPHKAFSYMAKRYHLEQIAIAGVHPGAEPSQREVMAIIDFLREQDINHVFFETTVSNRTAETIAHEVGAKTLVLNPVENLTSEERNAGETYFSIMRKNLKNLKIALGG